MSDTVTQVSVRPASGTMDVGQWPVFAAETIGGEEKYWLLEPTTQTRWLFKPNNVHQTTETRPAWSQREDIAEKVAAEVAQIMGVPCATVEYALRDNLYGCISRNLTPADWEKGTAWRFEHETGQKVPTLVTLAGAALSMVSDRVQKHWLTAVERVDHNEVARVTSHLSEVSEVTGTFISQVVTTNRRRVLDVGR